MITDAYLAESASTTMSYALVLWIAGVVFVATMAWQCVVHRLGLLVFVGAVFGVVLAVWVIGAAPLVVLTLGLFTFGLRTLRLI